MGPIKVLNIMLNFRASVSSVLPQLGQAGLPLTDFTSPYLPSARWSARKRDLQDLQSIIGSTNPSTCPDASQIFGFIKIAESKPYISSRSWTNIFHQAVLILFLSSTPNG